MNKENLLILNSIASKVDFSNPIEPKNMFKNMFVVTGPNNDSMINQESEGYFRIGYVTQVRLRAGAFGSDMVFIRYVDEKLITHENQSYYLPSKEDEAILKKMFPKEMYESDANNDKYTDPNKIEERGFIIHNSSSIDKERIDSFSMTISKNK